MIRGNLPAQLGFCRSSFAIFVAQFYQRDQQADWESPLMAALKAKVPELLVKIPALETAEVLDAKLTNWPTEKNL